MNNILDKDKFSKRASRYIQLTGQVGGLLTKLGANRFLGVNIDKDKLGLNLNKVKQEKLQKLKKNGEVYSRSKEVLRLNY